MTQKKSLSEMNEKEIKILISRTSGCLQCGKALSYKVLGSRFCLECNLKYSNQIRALIRRSRQISIVEDS